MKRFIKNIDAMLSEKYVNAFRYTPFIQTILLHKIYPSRKEVTDANGTVAEGVDVKQFETFVSYFVKRGYLFIDDKDITGGNIDAGRQYIYLTFDDGYYNNFHSLEVLEKYKAKATYYFSTNHIKEQKAYWWDALWREMDEKGFSKTAKNEKMTELKNRKWFETEDYLKKQFGEDALKPRNDIDRPMTKEELAKFGAHPLVSFGNHTDNHLNITLYSPAELQASIKSAETFIKETTGKEMNSVSYPYGINNDAAIEAFSNAGYKVGITIVPGKNKSDVAASPFDLLRLNRTQLSGFFDMETQCRNINVNFSITKSILQRK